MVKENLFHGNTMKQESDNIIIHSFDSYGSTVMSGLVLKKIALRNAL